MYNIAGNIYKFLEAEQQLGNYIFSFSISLLFLVCFMDGITNELVDSYRNKSYFRLWIWITFLTLIFVSLFGLLNGILLCPKIN